MLRILIIFLNITSVVWGASTNLDHLAQQFGIAPSYLPALNHLHMKNNIEKKTCSKLVFQSIDRPGRENLLKCLTTAHQSIWDESLFTTFFNWQQILFQKKQTQEILMSLALNNYLMDLTRAHLSQYKPAAWYIKDQKLFSDLTVQNRDQYPYEEGDLVVTYGDGGTSGLITQSTGSSYRFSHAFLIEHSDNEIKTLEIFPQTGAQAFHINELKKQPYTHMMVLRWKNKDERNRLRKKAVYFANKWIKDQPKFDYDLGLLKNDKVYCTMMVASAYAFASDIFIQNLFPDQKTTTTPELIRFARDVGVRIPAETLSPRSIITSPYFEVVAEYRNTENLIHSWQISHIISLLTASYQHGYEIQPSWFFQYIQGLFYIPGINQIPFIKKNGILARNIGSEEFSKLATLEKSIIARLIKENNKEDSKNNFLQQSLWERLDHLDIAFQSSKNDFLKSSNEKTTLKVSAK